MTRRDLLKALAAIPFTAVAQADWIPSFFTPHQNDTYTAFADLVIPTTDTAGARDALVNRYLDKILAASDPATQNQVTEDVRTLDAIAGGDFPALTPAQQTSLVQQLMRSPQSAAFDRLKAWTARIYYATKPGYDELNKQGESGKRSRPLSFACF